MVEQSAESGAFPKRVQRQRTKGWRMPEGAVYVGRPTLWGNPFGVSQVKGWPRWGGAPPWIVTDSTGKVWHPEDGRKVIVGRQAAGAAHKSAAMALAVDLYCEALRVFEPDEDSFWDPLTGHDLACWCPLSQPCHADVLLKGANPTVPTGTEVS